MVQIVNCECDRHGETILRIFNEAIATSTALYEYKPRTHSFIEQWFALKQAKNYPVIGIEDSNSLLGFATYGSFRPFAACQHTIEHSVYVDSAHRGKGLGKKLLQQLMLIAQQQKYHTSIGVIDAENQVSIQLHQSMGFQHCGSMKQVGFKFGKWLDVELYQLMLTSFLLRLENDQLNLH